MRSTFLWKVSCMTVLGIHCLLIGFEFTNYIRCKKPNRASRLKPLKIKVFENLWKQFEVFRTV